MNFFFVHSHFLFPIWWSPQRYSLLRRGFVGRRAGRGPRERIWSARGTMGRGKLEGGSLLSLSPFPSSPARFIFFPQAPAPRASPTQPLRRREETLTDECIAPSHFHSNRERSWHECRSTNRCRRYRLLTILKELLKQIEVNRPLFLLREQWFHVNMMLILCYFLGPVDRAYSWYFWVEVCRPVLKTLALFQTKIYDFPYSISDWLSKCILYFKPFEVW